MFRLDGKVALVTGGARGIGRGCAAALARAGAAVVLNDRPGSDELAATVAELRDLGASAWGIEADVFSRAGCEALLSAAFNLAGGIEILVSNPAYGQRGAFLDYDPDTFERVVAGTMTAGFHMGQLVARQMVERQTPGRIVFISSVHAAMPYARSVAYNAAKAGLNHMARTMAAELAARRINVNVIEPGWIDTPGERQRFGDDAIRQAAETLPLGRLGTPADIGAGVVYLASEAGAYVTGTVLRIDGGFVLKDAR